MDKEEIIIDGVNVKDCKRRFGKNSYCRYFKRPCADNNFNCIWKQHERLKAENVKLLFDKGTLIEFCNKLTKIIDEKKENENKILQILSEIKQLVSTDYIKTKKQLVQNYDCLDNFMQKIEDKCNEVQQ